MAPNGSLITFNIVSNRSTAGWTPTIQPAASTGMPSAVAVATATIATPPGTPAAAVAPRKPETTMVNTYPNPNGIPKAWKAKSVKSVIVAQAPCMLIVAATGNITVATSFETPASMTEFIVTGSVALLLAVENAVIMAG